MRITHEQPVLIEDLVFVFLRKLKSTNIYSKKKNNIHATVKHFINYYT